jgi:DNA-binding NarL/FixJ family response regulator
VIVENQPILLETLSQTAALAGLTVLAEVIDSRKVLETGSKLAPDLILFSVGTPNLRDLEQIAALRRELPDARILALVTGEFRGQEQTALDYGAHKVLTKAVSLWELIETLKDMSSNFRKTPMHLNLE